MQTKKKVLIAGGAGYIGAHTVPLLAQHGYQCVVLDNLIYGHKEAVTTPYFENVDLLDKPALERVFEKYAFDAVIHFAAFTYVGESVTTPQKYYENNVVGTLNLLESMLRHGVKKIVFSSTCATYGNPLYTPIDETHPQNPINPYGRAKLMVEQIFSDYEHAYGLRHISLHYFNAAGASTTGDLGESHSPETHLIPLVLQAIAGKREAIHIFGTDYDTPDGTCLRDYIHVEDLAVAHCLALDALDRFCGCINLGTGTPTSVKEIITAAEKITQKACPVQYAPRRAGDPAVLFASNALAKKIWGWVPQYTDIHDILRTVWNWECNRKF